MERAAPGTDAEGESDEAVASKPVVVRPTGREASAEAVQSNNEGARAGRAAREEKRQVWVHSGGE